PVSPIAEMLKYGLLGFDDVSTPDEPKRIIYVCEPDGHVSRYSIHIVTHDASRARAIYLDAKGNLQSLAGPPAFDTDKLDPAQKDRLRLAAINVSAVTRWKNVNHEDLTVTAETLNSKGEWGVSISVSAAKN